MATFREVAYAISDLSKSISDDSTFTIEHIIFLMSKYRNYILNSNASAGKKELTDANYQTIKIDFLTTKDMEICCESPLLVSTKPIPTMLTIGHKIIYPKAGFTCGNIQLVNYNSFKYKGYNKYLTNIIYGTIGPDEKLYLKSNNTHFLNLEGVYITAIFAEADKAALLTEIDGCVDSCDILDKHFPLDDSYIPTLIQVVTQEILGAAWRPQDDKNNAKDDLGDLATVITKFTNNKFQNLIRGKANE